MYKRAGHGNVTLAAFKEKLVVTNPSGQHVVHIEIVERQPHDVEQLGRFHLISFY